MPEVHLAWRAVVCGGRHPGQLFVVTAPRSQQLAVETIFPSHRVRRCGLGLLELGIEAIPCRGYGADWGTFGVVAVSRQGMATFEFGQDVILTIEAHDKEVARLVPVLEVRSDAAGYGAFVLALGLPEAAESAVMASLASKRDPMDIEQLQRDVFALASRHASSPG
jgi:hypothetical protein